MFKVNNEDNRTTSLTALLLTNFTPCSTVFIVNFEHVTAGWEPINETLKTQCDLIKTKFLMSKIVNKGSKNIH